VELAIDTSTDTASIALSQQGNTLAEMSWPSGQGQTVELIPNIVHLLSQNKTDIDQVEAIVVAKGPGSFNGLRVGVGTAKGFASALAVPLVGIGTLEVESFPHAETGLPVCPVQSAGRGEVASAIFQLRDGVWQRLVEEHITTVDELCTQIETNTIFCGRFSSEIEQRIGELLQGRAIILNGTLRRAGYLAQLGWKRLERGEADDVATMQPLYLRRPQITKPRKGKR